MSLSLRIQNQSKTIRDFEEKHMITVELINEEFSDSGDLSKKQDINILFSEYLTGLDIVN